MEKFPKLTIIIPTFYPGPIINNCIDSLPEEVEIIIIDNGDDEELKNTIKKKKHNITHYKIGDVGLPKSFNFALNKAQNEDILITQPDVKFEKNTLYELIKASKVYKNAGLLAPIIYEDQKYSMYNSLDLHLSKKGEIQTRKRIKNKNKIPSGDFCVEAVNATTMLLKKSILQKIGGWDENIYTYLEDIDLCLKLRRNNFSIIKVNSAIVNHVGFGSHKKENAKKSDLSRNWHFCWSSLYFRQKYYSKRHYRIYFFKIFLKYLFKSFVNICLFRFEKFKRNFYRLRACVNYLVIKKSNFRV